MTKPRVLPLLIGSLLAIGLLALTARAQPRAGAPAPSGSRFSQIALVDVGYIFKNHQRFKQYMADLTADMERADLAMKKERDAVKTMQDRLNTYRSGTPDYDDLEKQIVGKLADFNARVALQRKEFLKAEAKIYHMIYQQIQEEIEAFAKENGVVAVLRFNSEALDIEKPDDVARGLNSQVVWHHPNLDITPYVMENLKRRTGTSNAANPTNPNYRFPK